ncbi:MAG: radical SAM protein [Turicibacter sp.]|nr:radical SAM protein [Turicibacter sp.]
MLLANTNCNLNCSYCFERNIKNHTAIVANDDKVYNFIQNIVNKVGYKNLSLEFTGGEPTLNMKFIENLVCKINSTYTTTLNLRYSMITNGTMLNDEILCFLNENLFSIQISLDGDKRSHDRERTSLAFGKTYDLITNNISNILKNYTNIGLKIRINLSKNNCKYIDLLLSDLEKLGWFEEHRDRIAIYYDFVDVPKHDFLYTTDTIILTEILPIYAKSISMGFKHEFKYINAGKCMIKSKNSITIHSNGDLYKCYSLVGYEDFIKDNIFECFCVDINKYDLLENLCLEDCEVKLLCHGGCAYRQYIAEGEIGINCRKPLLMSMNKLLYLAELHDIGVLSHKDQLEKFLIEEYAHVQINKIRA